MPEGLLCTYPKEVLIVSVLALQIGTKRSKPQPFLFLSLNTYFKSHKFLSRRNGNFSNFSWVLFYLLK